MQVMQRQVVISKQCTQLSQWEAISVDEYAAFQKANGAKLIRLGSTWWARVAPFFFRPLNPFLQLAPTSCKYPWGSLLGGVQHAVADPIHANSRMRFFIYEDLQSYDLGVLSEKRRRETRRSLEYFTARRITNPVDFLNQAHPVYQEFYERTGYGYRKQRVQRRGFQRWAEALFSHPGFMIIGAYHRGRLAAIDVSFRIGGIIFDDLLFSNNASQRKHVTNFMVHTLRSSAAETDATWIYRGAPSTSPSLDDSKLQRGCRLLSLPANYRANPLALALIRTFKNTQYRRLLGVDIHSSSPSHWGQEPNQRRPRQEA